MKLSAFLFVGALALGGCSTISTLTGASVSPQSALVAANSFDALETAATSYLQLPACATPSPTGVVCRNAAAAKAIGPAVRSGRTARNQIEALLAANSGAAIPVATLATLQAAIASLQSIYTQYNIQS
jgi:hypothetical protein